MGQSPYFASPTPRSFRRVFNIVSKAVSQSISPPPPGAGGFFDSVPGFVDDRSPNDSGFGEESGDSLSGVCVGGFQGGAIGRCSPGLPGPWMTNGRGPP